MYIETKKIRSSSSGWFDISSVQSSEVIAGELVICQLVS
jgi:hypothetical protein